MKIEVLVGMIGSGKSTYARRRADEGALVLSHDDLTSMLHVRYRYEPGLRACYTAMLIQLATNTLVAGRSVIVDRTHLTRESRAVWLEVARQCRRSGMTMGPAIAGVEIVAITFPILSAELHAIRRFKADPRGRTFQEWLEVAEHHAGQASAEPLSADEGFDAIMPAPHFAGDPT